MESCTTLSRLVLSSIWLDKKSFSSSVHDRPPALLADVAAQIAGDVSPSDISPIVQLVMCFWERNISVREETFRAIRAWLHSRPSHCTMQLDGDDVVDDDDCDVDVDNDDSIILEETLDWAGGSTFTPKKVASGNSPLDASQRLESPLHVEVALLTVVYAALDGPPNVVSGDGDTGVVSFPIPFATGLIDRLRTPHREAPPPPVDGVLRNTLKAVLHRVYAQCADLRTPMLAHAVNHMLRLMHQFAPGTSSSRHRASSSTKQRNGGRGLSSSPLGTSSCAHIVAAAAQGKSSPHSTIPPWVTSTGSSSAAAPPPPRPMVTPHATTTGAKLMDAQQASGLLFAGVGPLLEVVGSVIAGWDTRRRALEASPLKRALRTAILGLHSIAGMVDEFTPYLKLYHAPLSHCVIQMIQREGETSSKWIHYIIDHWPRMYAKMETLLIGELEDVLEHTSPSVYARVGSGVTRLLSELVGSLNFAVVQRTCILLSNDKVLRLFHQSGHGGAMAMGLSSVLHNTATQHFNDTSRQMCYRVLEKMGRELDPTVLRSRAFRALQAHYDERDAEEARQDAMKRRKMREKKEGLGPLDFGFGKVLGVGSYSTVQYAKLIGSHAQQRYWGEYAIKIMDKKHLEDTCYASNAKMELDLLQRASHPNVVSLIDRFETDEKIYVVLEYADGGDVFHLLEALGSVQLAFAQFVIAETLLGLKYLHEELRVAHLDIKPENLLICDGHVKLTDFGSVTPMDAHAQSTMAKLNEQRGSREGAKRVRFAGTAEYVAPELIRAAAATTTETKATQETSASPSPSSLGAADLYALGCVLYQLLAGRPPFHARNDSELFDLVSDGRALEALEFPTEEEGFTESARALCQSLLHPDPSKRIGSKCCGGYKALMEHAFFKGIDWEGIPLLKASECPRAVQGGVKKESVPLKLRQRRYSMMLTQAIAAKYIYESFTLDPIEEIFLLDDEDAAAIESAALTKL